MFEKYQRAARAGPDKKEREEIENLRSQVQLAWMSIFRDSAGLLIIFQETQKPGHLTQ